MKALLLAKDKDHALYAVPAANLTIAIENNEIKAWFGCVEDVFFQEADIPDHLVIKAKIFAEIHLDIIAHMHEFRMFL